MEAFECVYMSDPCQCIGMARQAAGVRAARDDPRTRSQSRSHAPCARRLRGVEMGGLTLSWNRGAVRIADFVTNSIPCLVTLAR